MKNTLQPFNACYIYHVIGTLNLEHIRRGLESLAAQEPFFWQTFMLYNGSDIPSANIMRIFDELKLGERFSIEAEYSYDQNTPKSAVADWGVQMRHIAGHDYYLCHKADFYLAHRAVKTFEELAPTLAQPFFINFKKLNCPKGFTQFERYGDMTHDQFLSDPTVTFDADDDRMVTAMEDVHPIWDGIMHAYSDSTRQFFKPTEDEIKTTWGACNAILAMQHNVHLSRHDSLFAMHMYHYVKERDL